MQKLWDFLIPEDNACHLCGRWSDGKPFCEVCLTGLDGCLLKQNEHVHPPISLCVAAWKHTEHARRIVHLLKYSADRVSASLLAEGMCMALTGHPQLIQRVDALVPVPLHPERELDRGYNQAFWLAENLSAHMGIPVAADLLVRVRATRTQVHHNRQQRFEGMKGAFAVARGKVVQGRKLLLVDDVFTTGATVAACAQTLLAAGVEEVYAVTACKA